MTITSSATELPPGLIVEILSPTRRSIDLVKKPGRPGDFGVPEYWVVDLEAQLVLVWRFAAGARDPERVSDVVGWCPSPDVESLSITVAELFRPM